MLFLTFGCVNAQNLTWIVLESPDAAAFAVTTPAVSKFTLAAPATTAAVSTPGVTAPGLAHPGVAPPRTDTPTAVTREVLDLSRAWRLALQNDHVYRAAISEKAAAQTEREQGRAGLLPQVSAAYHRSRVTGNTRQADLGRPTRSTLDYDSLNAYVQVQQPVLNYARYADYRRGNARADLGDAVFLAKQQAAGIRVATAYFNALLAYEDRALQRALTSSLQNQAAAIEASFRRNEASRIDVQETEARLAVAHADLIDAEDQWTIAVRELDSLVGVAPTHLAVVRKDFPLLPLDPEALSEWLEKALINNAEVRAARLAVIAATTEVDAAASRYLPSTDLVAEYGRAKSENLSTLSQKTNTFSIGIQVSIPLFAGGYNRANVSRARSDRLRLQHELRAAIERTQAETTRQYTNVRAGADLIQALREAVDSGELSLKSAQRGFELGVSSNLEMLKVQDRLYQTRYELAKAQLEYVLARLKLAAAAGTLDADTFDEINNTYLDEVVSLADSRHREARARDARSEQ